MIPERALTAEELAKRGRTLFEYVQQLRWGEVLIPDRKAAKLVKA